MRAVLELSDDERWARLAWAHLAEPANQQVHHWISDGGASAALRRVASGRVATDGAVAVRLAELDLERAIHNLDAAGVRVLIPGDDEWPLGLDDLAVPPYALFVRGRCRVDEVLEGSVAVVGSRAASGYGTAVASDLGSGLAARGVTLVSGAAFGIDAAAHRGVLADDGVTVAVLACGLDRAYPSAHAGLLTQIAQTGLVLSEVPLGGAPFRSRFLARNRIIATITVGTVVVEASLRSGSLSTARWAREHNRYVAAVPGPVTSMTSAGCHVEIRERGAELVTDTADVMDLMGRLGVDLADPRRPPASADGDLTPAQRAVWSAVPVRSSATIESIVRACGESSDVVLAALGHLELVGLATSRADGWRKVLPSRRGQR